MDIPICAAKNVEGCEAKGILISPMYIYIKKCGGLWGVGGVCNLKLCELVGSDHCLLTNTSDNI